MNRIKPKTNVYYQVFSFIRNGKHRVRYDDQVHVSGGGNILKTFYTIVNAAKDWQ